jgi:hypothetical protein
MSTTTTTDNSEFDIDTERAQLAYRMRVDAVQERASARVRELRRQRAEGLHLDARDQLVLDRAEGRA